MMARYGNESLYSARSSGRSSEQAADSDSGHVAFCCSCRSSNCGDSRVPSADKCAGEVIGAGDALVTFV
jgi:hypothetical protein